MGKRRQHKPAVRTRTWLTSAGTIAVVSVLLVMCGHIVHTGWMAYCNLLDKHQKTLTATDALLNRVQLVTEENKNLTTQLRTTDSKLKQAKQDKAELEVRVYNLTQEKEVLETTKKTLVTQAQNLTRLLKQAGENEANLEAQRKSLSVRWSQALEDVASCEVQLQHVKKTLARVNKEKANLEVEMQDVRTRLAQVKDNKEKLEKQAKELERERQKLSNNVEVLTRENKALRQEIGKLHSDHEELEHAHKEQLHQATQDRDGLLKRIRELEDQVKKQSEVINDLRGELSRMESQLNECRETNTMWETFAAYLGSTFGIAAVIASYVVDSSGTLASFIKMFV